MAPHHRGHPNGMCPWHPIIEVTPMGCVHGTPSHRSPHGDVSMAPHHRGHPIGMCPWHPIIEGHPIGMCPWQTITQVTPSGYVHGTPSKRSHHRDVSMAPHHRGHIIRMHDQRLNVFSMQTEVRMEMRHNA